MQQLQRLAANGISPSDEDINQSIQTIYKENSALKDQKTQLETQLKDLTDKNNALMKSLQQIGSINMVYKDIANALYNNHRHSGKIVGDYYVAAKVDELVNLLRNEKYAKSLELLLRDESPVVPIDAIHEQHLRALANYNNPR